MPREKPKLKICDLGRTLYQNERLLRLHIAKSANKLPLGVAVLVKYSSTAVSTRNQPSVSYKPKLKSTALPEEIKI